MTLTASPPKCDANSSGRAATDWGMDFLPCQTRVGLRSFMDREGVRRYFCAAPGHRANVERRFGVSEAIRVERVIERITAEFDADIEDDEYEFDRESQPEFNGAFR